MKHFHVGLALVAALCVIETGYAAIDVKQQDIKLPSQQLAEKQTISVPVVAATARILSASAGDVGSGSVTVTSFLAQPDVPRNLTVTSGGTTANVTANSVWIYGTDFFDQPLMEEFAFTAAQSATITGNLAFKSVTSVKFPNEASPYGATWSVGIGSKLGMSRCMAKAGHLLFATLSGDYESTRPTVAVGASVANNVAALSGTLNGSKDVELFFFQNFACLP